MQIEDLLRHIDLPALVRQAGGNPKPAPNGHYRCACPLHGGDNPTAFQMYLEGGIWRWRCWTDCSEGGDALDFVQRWQGLDFFAAVRYLVEWARLSPNDFALTPAHKRQMQEQKSRTDLLDMAARFAAQRLWSKAGEHALAYARSRGFTDEIIRLAGFGYLDGSTALREHLAQAGANMPLAHKLGLIRQDGRDFTANGNGVQASPSGYLVYVHRPYPRGNLRHCKVCDAQTWHVKKTCLRHGASWEHLTGVEYLSARAIAPVAPQDKARNLPGRRRLYKAEISGGQGETVILVEGQADAESGRQLGHTAWALCGLGSIPEDDLAVLRQSRAVYLMLDADEHGQGTRMERLARQIGPLAMVVPPVEKENIKDLNDWLRAGATEAQVDAHLRRAQPWIDMLLERLKDAQPHEVQTITRQLVGMLPELPEELAPRYFQKVQRRLGMGRKELRQLVNEVEESTREDDTPPRLANIRNGCLALAGEPLGNFQVAIEKELILDDGENTPEVRYTVSGKLANGEPLPPVELEAGEFAELSWIGRYWGARPILYIPFGRRHLFVRAAQEISLDTIQRERVFTHTGWTTIGGQRSYLTTGGRITAQGFDGQVRVDLDHHLQRYSLPAPPTGSDLAAAVRASLDFLCLGPMTVTAPLWASMYAAPLSEFLPLYSLLWFYGPTQSGKSTVVHLALTHFGQTFVEGRQYHAPTDWMSTVTHLEESMFVLKDAPLVIDDFAPQFHSRGESIKMHSAAARVTRAVGNRSARGRSRKYQKRTLTPRGLVLSTAELPLSGESTVGRMLYVPVARGDILPADGERSRPALDTAQQCAQTGEYARAMAAYIRYLAAHWDMVVEKGQSIREESLRIIRGTRKVQNRLPDYFATLDAAQQLALGAFLEMGVISAHEAGELVERVSIALADVVASQAEKISAESPVRKFFEALDNLLQRRKVYLAPRTQRFAYVPPVRAELIGWAEPDEEKIYLNDATCLAQAREYWAALGENFDTTTDALRRQISQVPGLLAERGKGYNITVSKYLGGRTRRALCIDKAVVRELYGISLQNEPPDAQDIV